MRARAGDPPRTMPQKVLAGRAVDPQLRGELVQVKVDQIILSRAPSRALGEALGAGMKKTGVELAVAYDGTCVTSARSLADVARGEAHSVSPDFPAHNIVVARPGIGFPAPVHLERFAAPARLAITDDPRMSTVGGLGMLTLVVSSLQLGQALATGMVWLRPPRSVQIHLSGRVRPFVCARDVALELVRRGLGEVVAGIEKEHRAPVVLEFVGPSAKLLSVSERAVLCGIAPLVGAASALFLSDEKTEAFLRDQRRSKAHRALVPDAGAPCEEVTSIDLATVDPLVMDEKGVVRPVRDLAGQPVRQVLLGGDSGVTLRDMLAVAMLLKSKRVPPRLDLLVAPPSRQVLEVLAQTGGVVDLAATGARFVEPDQRVLSMEFYPPPSTGLSLRTADPEPRLPGTPGFVVASAETLAYAVATGAVGDPRLFKRPVRVTVPRVLPTDDVLVLREKAAGDEASDHQAPSAPVPSPWKVGAKLSLVSGLGALDRRGHRASLAGSASEGSARTEALPAATPAGGSKGPKASKSGKPEKAEKAGTSSSATTATSPSEVSPTQEEGVALVLSSNDEVLAAQSRGLPRLPGVRAIVGSALPSQAVSAMASEGIACFELVDLGLLEGKQTLEVPSPAQWKDEIEALCDGKGLTLRWSAQGAERAWTLAGSPRTGAPKVR